MKLFQGYYPHWHLCKEVRQTLLPTHIEIRNGSRAAARRKREMAARGTPQAAAVPRRPHPVHCRQAGKADRPSTEMFEEGAAVAICFAPEHCVPLET